MSKQIITDYMRQGQYVPTTEEVCSGFRGDPRKFEQAGEPIDAIGSNYGSKCYAAFHRWLKEHDKRIRSDALAHHDAEALRLTDRELACAVNGFIAAGIMDYPVEECINYAIRNVRLLREWQVSHHEQGKIDWEADHE